MDKKQAAPEPEALQDAKPATEAIVIDQEIIKFKKPFKEQSYLVHGTPPKLVVAANAKRTQDHGSICRQVLDYIQATPGCTSAQALAKRAELLADA